MKKVGSSFKKLGAIFLSIVLLFFLFSMFSGSREGFGTCTVGNNCDKGESTCVDSGPAAATICHETTNKVRLTCQATGTTSRDSSQAQRKWGNPVCVN